VDEFDFAYLLSLEPKKAVEFLFGKDAVLSWDWTDLWEAAHARAFTVAKVMRMDILTDIRSAVEDAVKNGTTFADFKKDLEPTLRSKGWWGTHEAIDPATGEVINVQLGSPWRLRTIYQTNLQTSYMAGRWNSQTENAEDRPYLQYVAVLDAKTRPAHRALNGLVFAIDDAFWKTHYPPNGFNCRCRTRAFSAGDITDRNLKVQDSEGKLENEQATVSTRTGETAEVTRYRFSDPITGKQTSMAPDPGFNYNPGATRWTPDLAKYPAEIRALYGGEA
jgi:SPP1 gp7 family putative phage head morphogenesis protein